MYLILTASKDTYITNKVISNKYRATDANVGMAGTLDLFKLYNESTLAGDETVIELSRLLIKFDLQKIRSLCSSSANINSSDFKAELKLFDLMGGQANPSNFKIVSYPLSQSFQEGVGRNVLNFSDLDAANWITASYTNSTAVGWFMSGANQGGHSDMLPASATITANGDGTNGQNFVLTDGNSKAVTFTTNNAVNYDTAVGDAALKTDATNYIIGLQNIAGGGVVGGRLALAVYRSIATAKADSTTKLAITTTNDDDGADTEVGITQDIRGSVGNTTIDLTTVDNLSIPAGTTGFIGGYTPQLDFISSGTLSQPAGAAVLDFGSSQYFKNGTEDVALDVTRVLSGTLDGRIPDFGFRLSFSGSEETDTKTRFVKRFGSRNSSNPFKVPQLHISWNDSVNDNHEDFIFDVSGSIFLNNFHRGVPANILSGAAATQITGLNSLLVRLENQNFIKYVTASQHLAGTQKTGSPGLYSASFAISLSDTTQVNAKGDTLRDLFYKSGSFVTFREYWTSMDNTIGYYTGSLKVEGAQRSSFKFNPSELLFRFTNLNKEYEKDDIVNLNVFVDDRLKDDKPFKIPYSRKSETLSNVFYRVREADSGKIIIPFMEDNKATQLSSNSDGMSFKFRMESLQAGRIYVFDLLVTDYGARKIYEGVSGIFRIV